MIAMLTIFDKPLRVILSDSKNHVLGNVSVLLDLAPDFTVDWMGWKSGAGVTDTIFC